MRTAEASAPDHNPGEDLLLLIAQEQDAIQHADTKLGFLLTVVALLTPRLFASADLLLDPTRPDDPRSWLGLGAYYVSTLAAVASFLVLLSGLAPRRWLPQVSGGSDQALNRFAWPAVARATFDDLWALTPRTARKEAIQQARVLARIAEIKFRRFDQSLSCAGVAALAALLWYALR